MLARIAHELYWIGRQLARAEHTARMLDGVFHADVQARPDDPAGVLLSWDHLLTIVSGEPPEQPGVARRGAARADARPRPPDVGPELRHARARGRAHGARRVLGRDVGGDQHVPPRAAAAGHVGGAAHRPVLRLRVRARALRAVLGRDEPHDAARRGARLPAGRRGDRVGRHGPADAARRAPVGPRGRRSTSATARRWRCCRRSAASRPTGARCPRRRTPARSRASCCTSATTRTRSRSRSRRCTRALTAADPSYRGSPAVLRVGRLMADLDFRARTAEADGALAEHARRRPARARAGRCRHRPAVLWRPGHAGRPRSPPPECTSRSATSPSTATRRPSRTT